MGGKDENFISTEFIKEIYVVHDVVYHNIKNRVGILY